MGASEPSSRGAATGGFLDPRPQALPGYAGLSRLRMTTAYGLSPAFTLVNRLCGGPQPHRGAPPDPPTPRSHRGMRQRVAFARALVVEAAFLSDRVVVLSTSLPASWERCGLSSPLAGSGSSGFPCTFWTPHGPVELVHDAEGRVDLPELAGSRRRASRTCCPRWRLRSFWDLRTLRTGNWCSREGPKGGVPQELS